MKDWLAPIGRFLKWLWRLVYKAGDEFVEDNCLRMAASISFYTMFSLPPLLVIVVTIAGTAYETVPEVVPQLHVDPAAVKRTLQEEGAAGKDVEVAGEVVPAGAATDERAREIAQALERSYVQRELHRNFSEVFGAKAADQIEGMLVNSQRAGGGLLPTLVGIVALIVGSTGVVAELQASLDEVWGVEPNPDLNSIFLLVFQRILSFGLVLALAFLLLASLIVSTLIRLLGDTFAYWVSAVPSESFLRWTNNVFLLVVLTVLFCAFFKLLPDVKVRWRDVGIGALVTTLLFLTGKYFVTLYLANWNLGTYGAASSLVVVLFWVYYTSLVMLVGAEFTQVWAQRDGRKVEPKRGASRIVRIFRRIRSR